jgi:hypothetical protein
MVRARHHLRIRVLARARRGEFASAREIGLVASVPVQTALRWLREAGIDIDAVRLLHLAKMYQRDQEHMGFRLGSPRPTKQQRRSEILRAVRAFNEAMAKNSRRSRAGRGEPPEVA